MQRKASAIWKGGLKDGKGVVSASSGVLSNTPYSFATRFENTPGTNPEELIAAAHAGCFSMALSGQLGAANLTASSIETTATLTLEKLDSGMGHHHRPSRRGRARAGRGQCGVSKSSGKCQERLPGVQSAQGKYHDDGEAGRMKRSLVAWTWSLAKANAPGSWPTTKDQRPERSDQLCREFSIFLISRLMRAASRAAVSMACAHFLFLPSSFASCKR